MRLSGETEAFFKASGWLLSTKGETSRNGRVPFGACYSLDKGGSAARWSFGHFGPAIV
jgi:hypothetical protein